MSKFHPLPIARVERETRDAVAITFAVPDALREQFRYAQGQHLTLRADDRRPGRAPLVFDLLGRAGRRAADRGQALAGRRLLDLGERAAEGRRHARRDAADGALQRAARRGARAPLRRLRRRQRHHAAPVDRQDDARRASRESRFTLFYGNRASGTVMFKRGARGAEGHVPRPLQPRPRALARGAGHRAPARAHRPREGRRAARPLGRRSPMSTPCSCAGPDGMMQAVAEALQARGYPEAKIKIERFATQHSEARAPAAPRCRRAARPRCEVTVILDGATRCVHARQGEGEHPRRRAAATASSCRTRARAACARPAAAG